MKRFVSCLILLMAFTASAVDDLVWYGGVISSCDWSKSTGNSYWFKLGDSPSASLCYTSGANVYFFQQYGSRYTSSRIITLKKGTTGPNFFVNDFWVSNATTSCTFDFKADDAKWFGADGGFTGKYDKFGAGTLRMRFVHGGEGDFTCHGGTFEARLTEGTTPDMTNSVYGSMAKSGRKITFMSGTVNNICNSWPMGCPTAGSEVESVYDGATLKITSAVTTGINVNFGKTTFNNATIGALDAKGGTVYFTGDLAFNGSSPYAIGVTGTMVLGKNGDFIGIEVPDLTGSSVSDVKFTSAIAGGSVETADGTKTFSKAFRKNGAGTLEITSESSTMDGDIDIAAGQLLISNQNAPDIAEAVNYRNSAIGMVDGCERTVTVDEGAELAVKGNASFGLLNTPMSWRLAVNGGTLSLGEGQYGFGTLLLNNATVNYENGCPYSLIHYGLISVGTKIGFYGKTPYDLAVKGVENLFTLGFNLDSKIDEQPESTGSIFTNMWNMVEFEVDDITGDDSVDASIGMAIRDMVNMCYQTYDPTTPQYENDPWKNYRFHCGIRKTGRGTLRLYGSSTYTYATKVEAGALVVDGSISASSELSMAAGTTLSGTGSLPALNLADGVIITADAEAAQGACLSATSLASEGTVELKVANVPELVDETYSVPILKLTSKPAEIDLSSWKITYTDSTAKRNVTLAYDKSNGTISLAYAATGSTLIVR